MTNQSKINKSITLEKAQIIQKTSKEAYIEQKTPKEAHIEQVAFKEAQIPENCEILVSYAHTGEK